MEISDGPPSRPLPTPPRTWPRLEKNKQEDGDAHAHSVCYSRRSIKELCKIFERLGATSSVAQEAPAFKPDSLIDIDLEGEFVKVAGKGDDGKVEEVPSIEYDEGTCKAKGQLLVRCATVNQLVRALTLDDCMDLKFQSVFFLTHRAFACTSEVLQRLKHRFEQGIREKNAVLTARVRSVVKAWARDFPEHFDGKNRDTLLKTASVIEAHGHTGFQQEVEQALAATASPLKKLPLSRPLLRAGSSTAIRPNSGAKVAVHGDLRQYVPHVVHAGVDLWDKSLALGAKEFARRVTQVDHALYSKIHSFELLDKSWTRERRDIIAKNVLAAIRWFNGFVAFLVVSFLQCRTLKQRSSRLLWILDVAAEFRSLGNFNCLFAVNGALGSAAISRLKHTIALLPQKRQGEVDGISTFCTSENYKHYRKALSSAIPPIVPYLGVYLQVSGIGGLSSLPLEND